uniref:Uncharacterized protein n=1 Tax=Anguilla anguilla TaxID=7936 RepID=A0A0E9UYC3_ANGAN
MMAQYFIVWCQSLLFKGVIPQAQGPVGSLCMDVHSRMSSTPDCASTGEVWLPWQMQGLTIMAA